MSTPALPTTIENPITLDLSPSYGALIIAAYLSCALWGINIMQAYIYYWNYPDDSGLTKTLVVFLLVLDTAHKVLITKVPWYTLVQNWGKVSAILASPEEALHEAWVGQIIAEIVQAYYLRRIAIFALKTRQGRSWWLWSVFALVCTLCIAEIPLTVAYLSFSINRINIFIAVNLRIKTACLVAAAVVDSAIAAVMIMLLKDAEPVDDRLQMSKRTARTIRRLMIIVVNTGLVTAIISIISLVLDLTASGQIFWTAIPQYPTCSIYLSAFLANLNARHYIRGKVDPTNLEDLYLSDPHNASASDSTTAPGSDVQAVLGRPHSTTNSVSVEALYPTDDHVDGQSCSARGGIQGTEYCQSAVRDGKLCDEKAKMA